MIINVYCPVYDKNFCLNVGLDFKIEDFKALCSAESGVSVSAMKLLFNNQVLTEDKRTLSSYKIGDNDMILLDVETAPTSAATQSASPTAIPPLNFSGIQVTLLLIYLPFM